MLPSSRERKQQDGPGDNIIESPEETVLLSFVVTLVMVAYSWTVLGFLLKIVMHDTLQVTFENSKALLYLITHCWR